MDKEKLEERIVDLQLAIDNPFTQLGRLEIEVLRLRRDILRDILDCFKEAQEDK